MHTSLHRCAFVTYLAKLAVLGSETHTLTSVSAFYRSISMKMLTAFSRQTKKRPHSFIASLGTPNLTKFMLPDIGGPNPRLPDTGLGSLPAKTQTKNHKRACVPLETVAPLGNTEGAHVDVTEVCTLCIRSVPRTHSLGTF